MIKRIPISHRVLIQSAKETVKDIFYGLVELITNSDDSYLRMENASNKVDGRIEIIVDRKKGGKCEKIIVRDYAQGMSPEQLEKALTYGGETSGFTEGKSVRGFFGRGLKESIVALGKGEIITVRNGKKCSTKVWAE